MLSFNRKDKYGQELRPGDVCARSNRDKVELVVYKGDAHGKTANYGRFISNDGNVTIKFTSVIFVFDPMLGSRRSKANQVNELVQQYYEGKK